MIRSSLKSEAIFVMDDDQSMIPSSSSHAGYCCDQAQEKIMDCP